jgi:hypothetical protein
MVASKARTRRYVKGDRFSGPMGEGTVTSVKKSGLFPYEITWWNGRSEVYSAEQIERYGYKHLPPDPDAEDIEEEELNLFDGDFPRDQEPSPVLTWKDWKKGDRLLCGKNGKRGVVEKLRFRPQSVFVFWDETSGSVEYSPEDLELLEIALDSGRTDFSRDLLNSDRSSKEQCLTPILGFSSSTNSLEELEGSAKLQNSPEVSPSATTSISTPTLKPSTDTITQVLPSTETSETITPSPEPTSTQSDSPAPELQPPALELDLITLNPIFGLKPCDASSRGVQTMWLLKTLKGFSTEDYGKFLGDSEWQDTLTTIRSSYRRLGSVLPIDVTGSLLLPTPTSYSEGSDTHQPAGQNKLERTLKLLPTVTASTGGVTQDLTKGGNRLERSLLPTPTSRDGKGVPGETYQSASLPRTVHEHLTEGQKMHPSVPGWMMGFQPGYAESLLMVGGATTQLQDTQALQPEPKDAEPVSKSTDEPSCPNKQRSLLDESSISTQSLKTEEELTPVDETAVGKHYWCDRLDVTVTVETVHNWRTSPRAMDLTKAARCRPWWGKFPDVMVIVLEDLVEIEKLSCLMEERPVEDRLSRSRISEIPSTISTISEISSPEISSTISAISEISSPEFPVRPITGISPNPIPDDAEVRSLGKSETNSQDKSLEKSQTKQSGSLYQYTANKADKSGNTSTYPKVEGERKREEDSHWYWGYSYIEKSNGKWRDRSASVPRSKLSAVREAMRSGKNYQYILQQVLGKD